MLKRAFTIVEMMVAMTIMVVLIGTVTVLFVHNAQQTSRALALNIMLGQARDLDQYLEHTIENAHACASVSRGLLGLSGSALQLSMPANVATTDAYGVGQTYSPNGTNGSNVTWGSNKYRWFYFADSSGATNKSGTILWMAESPGPALPTSGMDITNWTYYNGNTTNYRWYLIDGFSYTVNSLNNTVTYTITASDLIPTNGPIGSSTDTQQSYSVSLTRTVYWRHST